MNIDATTIASINKTIQTDDTCAFNSLIFQIVVSPISKYNASIDLRKRLNLLNTKAK